jgi:hypothetical protein
MVGHDKVGSGGGSMSGTLIFADDLSGAADCAIAWVVIEPGEAD